MTIFILLYLLIAGPLFSSETSHLELTYATPVTFFLAVVLSFNIYRVATLGFGVSFSSRGLFPVSSWLISVAYPLTIRLGWYLWDILVDLIKTLVTSRFGTMLVNYSTLVVNYFLSKTSTMYYVLCLVLVDITTTFYLQTTCTLIYFVGLFLVSLLLLVTLLKYVSTEDSNNTKHPIITECLGSSNNWWPSSAWPILLPFVAWFIQYSPQIEGDFTVDSAILVVHLLSYLVTLILVIMFTTFVLVELFKTPCNSTTAVRTKTEVNTHTVGVHSNRRHYSTSLSRHSDNKNATSDFDMDEIHNRVALSKDPGGPTTVPHFIAKRHIDAKLPPTVAIINQVLARQNIVITDDDLALFASLKPLEFTMPIKQDRNNSSRFNYFVGASNASTSIAGVYIWTNISTNRQYVGSSVALHTRVRSYYNKGSNQSSIAKEIRANPSKFRLTIYTIPEESNRENLWIALEQYFFFVLRPQINVHMEAGTRGGKKDHDRDVEYYIALRQDKSQWVHFYNKERTQRHLSFSTQREAERALNSVFTRSTLTVHNNTVLWDSYWITNETIAGTEDVPLSKEVVRDTLAKGKAMSYKNRPRKPSKPLSQPRVQHGSIYYIDPVQRTAQLYADVGSAADSISESLNINPVNARTNIRLALRNKGRAYNKVFVKQSEFESQYNVINGFYQFKASENIPEHWPI